MKQHRDGNTAQCPHFGHRISYMGRHAIVCHNGDAKRRMDFVSRESRDSYYVGICCSCDRCTHCKDYEGGKENV